MVSAVEIENKYTHIRVPTYIHDKLKQMQEKDESLGDVIERLIKFYEDMQSGNYKAGQGWVVQIPPERYEDVLIAIEEVKSPTKWRDIVRYFILSVFGGIGLGLFLALR